MSTSASGKTLYWKANETLDVKLTEMFKTNTYQGTVEMLIGEKSYTHFVKDENGKFSVVKCPGRATCDVCRAGGEKPRLKFTTKVVWDGELRYADLALTLSRELGKTQKMLRSMGKSDEDILDTTFRVTHLTAAPWWTVDIVDVGRVSGPKEEVALDDLEEPEDDVPAVKLTADEAAYIRKYEKNIKTNLAKDPAWPMEKALKEVLTKRKWPTAKQETALKMFDKTGSFVENKDLVEA